MSHTGSAISLLRQLHLPTLRFSESGALLECSPEAEVLLRQHRDTVIPECANRVRRMAAAWSRATATPPSWRGPVPSADPCCDARGTFLQDAGGARYAIVVLLPWLDTSASTDGAEQSNGVNVQDVLRQHGLTPREVEIATLIADGRSSPAISQEIRVTVHTVRRHTESVFRKLGLRRRAELARVFGHLSRPFHMARAG